MFSRKKTGAALLTVVFCVTLLLISLPPAQAKAVLILENEEFAPAVATYTNKTMHFQVADPYDGFAHWTYELGGTVQGPSDNKYQVSTGTNGYAEYFGFDEFVDHNPVWAEVIFRTTLIAGIYHFQPLAYFYQKTALESDTHWALAIDWDATGIDLMYNTGNGNAPTSVNLVGTAPTVGVDYRCILSNLGEETFVYVEDIITPSVLYSGYTTTESYDATSLYAGFGQYSSGSGNIYGRWDNFSIVDSTFTYPSEGVGFNRIDAYVDEVFTQTLFDMDGGANPVLAINATATNITLLVSTWLNATTYGVSTLAEGKNIIRHNVTVMATNSTVVFSQSNFTYISGADYGENVFLYEYFVELIFTPVSGQVYTVTITYEIFYALEVGG